MALKTTEMRKEIKTRALIQAYQKWNEKQRLKGIGKEEHENFEIKE